MAAKAKESSDASSSSHTVFVETNLNTHLVAVATDHDTVADLKQKVSMGHSGCFPDIGEIIIHSLKIRRNGHFYHLVNSIPVKSAFDGVKKSWFLHVDATPSQGKATLGNNHQNLSKDVDVRILPQQTPEILGPFIKSEIHNSVNEIGESNAIPCSALGKPHETFAAVAAVDDGNLDSLQELDMGGASSGKLQGRADSETTSTFKGTKKKRRKKRKMTQSGQPDTETELNMKDVGSSNPLVTSAVVETEDPGNKRRKKPEKSKDADAKSNSHANNAEDVVPLTSDQRKSFDTDLGTKEDIILLQTEDRQLSKVCSVESDKIEEKSVLQNGGPKIVIEAKSIKSNTRDSCVSAIDVAVSMETRDLSDESNKKSNKSKTADSHANSAKDIISQTESSFDGDLGMKIDSVLFQTENKQLSIVCPHDNGKIEEKSMSKNENFATVLEAKGTLSHVRDIDVSAIDAAISTEAQNPTLKRRKKFKKHKTSNAERKVSTSGAERIEISENAIHSISKFHGPSVQDYSGTETNKVDINFFPTEYVEVAKVECLDMRGNGFHDKVWQGAGHEDTSIQLSTDDVGNKVDHKESKPSVSTSNSVLKDQGVIEQVAHTENSSLSTKGKKEEVKSSKRKRKSKLKTDDSPNELCNVRPEAGAVGEFEAKSLQQQDLSDHAVSPQLPSSPVNYGIAEPRVVNESRDGTKGEVNFRNYFGSKNGSQVIAPVEELMEKDVPQAKHDKKLKTDKKAKPCTSKSLCTSSDFEKTHPEVENQGRKKKTMSAIPNTFQPQRNNLEPHDSNLSTARENVETPLDDNVNVEAFPIKVSRDKIVDSSEEVKSPHEVQFHSPSSSKVHTSSKVNCEATKESFVEKIGDFVSGSQNQKSSLDVPKKVYSESSSESYEDKGHEKQDLDGSISDEEKEVNMNSPGSSGRNITHNGGNRSAYSHPDTAGSSEKQKRKDVGKSRRCKKCNGIGHMAKTCGVVVQVVKQRNSGQCEKCQGFGHLAKTCGVVVQVVKQRKSRQCKKCLGFGHMAKTCTAAGRAIKEGEES